MKPALRWNNLSMNKNCFLPVLVMIACMVTAVIFPCCAALANEPNPIPVLADNEIPPTPPGIHHYLLLCADSWNARAGNLGNTDGMVLLTLDTEARRIMLTSFSRDLLVLRPDDVIGRLTYVANTFGPDQLVSTFNRNFGLRIEKYVIINWGGVRNIIDAAGGVDIKITGGEAIRLKDKLTYKTDWTSPALQGAGTYHFKGYAAVIYMRIRSDTRVDGNSQDLVRTSRARAVLSSLADSLSTVTFADAAALASTASSNIIATNMSMSDVAEALSYAFPLQGIKVEQFRIPFDDTAKDITYVGMQVYQMDYPANRKALMDFLYYTSFLVVESK
jgi:polyisoprenyl-teichoic acid--peptidoglycan teichoic acid transferase